MTCGRNEGGESIRWPTAVSQRFQSPWRTLRSGGFASNKIYAIIRILPASGRSTSAPERVEAGERELGYGRSSPERSPDQRSSPGSTELA